MKLEPSDEAATAVATASAAPMNALAVAAQQGGVARIEALLQAGADVDSTTSTGLTALHLAVHAGACRLDAVDALLQAGATQLRDISGQTPLHRASHFGDLDVVLHLLDGGAQEDAPDINGHTPLHVAAHCGHVDVARELVRRGANVRGRDVAGQTPIRLAELAGHTAAVRSLCEYLGDGNLSFNAVLQSL